MGETQTHRYTLALGRAGLGTNAFQVTANECECHQLCVPAVKGFIHLLRAPSPRPGTNGLTSTLWSGNGYDPRFIRKAQRA